MTKLNEKSISNLYISTHVHGIYEGTISTPAWMVSGKLVSDVSSLQANNQLEYLPNMKPACYQLNLIWSIMVQGHPLVAEWCSVYKVLPCFSQNPTVHCYVQSGTYSKATKQVCLYQIKKKGVQPLHNTYNQSHPVVQQQHIWQLLTSCTRYMKWSQMFTHTQLGSFTKRNASET